MNKHFLDERGFAHYIAVFGVISFVAIGVVFAHVLQANHNAVVTANQQQVAANARAKDAATSNAKSQAKAETVNNSNQPVQGAASGSANTGSKQANPTAPVTTRVSPTPAVAAPTPVSNMPIATVPSPGDTPQNELYELTNIISDFQSNVGNNTIYITTNLMTVPGPVSNATARPIVFGNDKLLAKKYFAYMQGAPINFSGSASAIASKMAIVTASGSYTTQSSSYISKSGVLQDTSMSTYLVGYSAGGN